jgi:hypothetical protein
MGYIIQQTYCNEFSIFAANILNEREGEGEQRESRENKMSAEPED